jgi:hypothetical protein
MTDADRPSPAIWVSFVDLPPDPSVSAPARKPGDPFPEPVVSRRRTSRKPVQPRKERPRA